MKNNIAHVFEDSQTGILWLSEFAWDETGIVKTANRELDLAQFKAIDAEYISNNHFGMCLAYDLIAIKNKKGMCSLLAPFHASMGNGAIYASICRGFEFKSAYGFRVANPRQSPTIYVVAETAKGKWGIIRIIVSNNIWNCYYDYDHLAFSMPQEIIPFEYKTMEDALQQSGLILSVASLTKGRYDDHGYIRDLTERNVDASDTIGISLDDMIRARKYKKWQDEVSLEGQDVQAQQINDTEGPITPDAESPKVLRITLSDGTIIQEKQACDTFIKALKFAGLDRVQPLKIPYSTKPIICDTYSVRNNKKPHLVDSKYIFTHSATWQKKDQLEDIGHQLGLKWKVEIV